MGVDIHVYGVWGIRIEGYPQDFSEAYDAVYDTCPLEIIMDGMNGEYMIFGEKLFDSGNIRYGMEDGDECRLINPDSFKLLEEEYKKEFCKWFPQFKYMMEAPFQMIMFTHYS